jgi:hypothetical protein
VQCEQKENKRKAAEHDQRLDEQHDDPGFEQHDDLGLEQHGRPDEDVNVMEAFKDFHTSTIKGMSNAARAAVVSTFIYFL